MSTVLNVDRGFSDPSRALADYSSSGPALSVAMMRAKINGQFSKQTFALTFQVANGISSVSSYVSAVSTVPSAKDIANKAQTGGRHIEYDLIGRRGPIGFAPVLLMQICHSCV